MSANTKIEWTNRTWNPLRGCSQVSAGCRNCYAMRLAHRYSGEGMPFEGLTKATPKGPVWTGKIMPVEKALRQPLTWKKPARVFVNSMSDLFHEDVPFHFIDRVFTIMLQAPQHTFQILTKRPLRARQYLTETKMGPGPWPLPNVHLGVSVESKKDNRGNFSYGVALESAGKDGFDPPATLVFGVPVYKFLPDHINLTFELAFSVAQGENPRMMFVLKSFTIEEEVEKVQQEVINAILAECKQERLWGSLLVHEQDDAWKYQANPLKDGEE